jgi:hypothetical protein
MNVTVLSKVISMVEYRVHTHVLEMDVVEVHLKLCRWLQMKSIIEEMYRGCTGPREETGNWKSSRILYEMGWTVETPKLLHFKQARESDTVEPYIQYYIGRTHVG